MALGGVREPGSAAERRTLGAAAPISFSHSAMTRVDEGLKKNGGMAEMAAQPTASARVTAGPSFIGLQGAF